MKYLILVLLAAMTCITSAKADIAEALSKNSKAELFARWYVGDWVRNAEETDKEPVIIGIRLFLNIDMQGCIMYPENEEKNRQLFGQIYDVDSSSIRVRLSNGNEITLNRSRKSDGTYLTLDHEDSENTEILERSFLPANCL